MDPIPSISAFFSALTPPCCHADSNLWSRASRRYVLRRLARWHRRRLLCDRQKMINEQSKCSTGKSPKTFPFFSSQHFKKLTEMKMSRNRALRDFPLLCATAPSLSLSLTVNRWLLLIDGCLPTQLNTNVRYQAFGPLLLTAVSTTLYQHPSVTLLALSSLIS